MLVNCRVARKVGGFCVGDRDLASQKRRGLDIASTRCGRADGKSIADRICAGVDDLSQRVDRVYGSQSRRMRQIVGDEIIDFSGISSTR